MDKVLESTKYVVENSKHAKINKDKIKDFCKSINHKHYKHWISAAPFNISNMNEDDRLNFLLVFNSISFSYWGAPKWTIEHQGEKFDGSWGMITALKRTIDEKKPILNPRCFSEIKQGEFKEILRANVIIPLFEERWKILREVGNVLTKKYKGEFSNLVKEANNDAMKLLSLIIANFPSFDDTATYKGKKVFFYKRAQLLVDDIYQAFNGKSYGNLKNIDKITACADYKLPQVLRKFDILSYSKELASKVDNKIQIHKNSEEEVEIRANTIWAVEFIKEELKHRFPNENSIHVNDHLWLLGQNKNPDDKPYHRTRTTAY